MWYLACVLYGSQSEASAKPMVPILQRPHLPKQQCLNNGFDGVDEMVDAEI